MENTPLTPPPVSDSQQSLPESEKVTAVTRGWSDLDVTKWFSLTASWSLIYSAWVHPMYFSATRRQTDVLGTARIPYLVTLRAQVAEYGVRGIYRGFFAMSCGSILSEWFYLAVLENCRERLPIDSSFVRDGVSGGLADFTSQLFYTPFGLIGNRQMAAGAGVSKYPYLSFPRYVQFIVSREGVRGLWVGLAPSLMLVPSSAVWWSMYGEVKRVLYENHTAYLRLYGDWAASLPSAMTSSDDNVVHNTLAGGVAGMCITALVNPVWVLRARVQVMEEGANRTLRFVMRDLWRKEGVKGFYKGASMNCLIYAMESALFGTFYEYFRYLASS